MELKDLNLKSLEGKEIIVDIDGTIAKISDRIKYIEQDEPDWDAFFEECDRDEPIVDIVDLVFLFSEFFSIRFCTGRPERVREKTHKWLNEVFGGNIPKKRLLMRKDGDHRSDFEVKPELLKEAGIKLKNIAFILEDRNSVVKKWRELGVRCLQVDESDF